MFAFHPNPADTALPDRHAAHPCLSCLNDPDRRACALRRLRREGWAVEGGVALPPPHRPLLTIAQQG